MKLKTNVAFRVMCLTAAACGLTAFGCNQDPMAGTTEGSPGVAVKTAPADPAADPAVVAKVPADDEAGHDHGPHGGEIVKLVPGDLDVEWVHDDESGKFTVWIATLVEAGKEIERAEVRVTGAGEPKVYALEKEGEDTYVATNAEMVTAIDAAGGEQDALQTQLVIVSDGAEHTARLVNMH